MIQNRVCISFDETTVCTNIATVWIEEAFSFTAAPERPVLSLAPNPNSGVFQVTCTAGAGSWWITDTRGNLIQNARASDNQYDVRMDTAEPGMYLFWAKGQSGLQVSLFTVIH